MLRFEKHRLRGDRRLSRFHHDETGFGIFLNALAEPAGEAVLAFDGQDVKKVLLPLIQPPPPPVPVPGSELVTGPQ